MPAALRKLTAVDGAIEELWRVAETNDVDELARILSRNQIDVDARNQHGMTALMRAAYQGNAKMVGVLLEHGADPNVMRNDRFTALALAAFFGHTETVRVLIEHGAKTEVVTRCGTSAHMWATARTFAEAARCLESRKRAHPRAVPAPAIEPAPAPAPAPIKILKDPPEIWDLVHEEPRRFDPGSAFVSRLRSMNRVVAVSVLTGLLLLVAGGVGVLLLRGSRARVVQPEAISTVTTEEVSLPSKVESKTIETPASETPASPGKVEEVESLPVTPVSHDSRRVQFKARSSREPIVVADPPKLAEPEKPVAIAAPQFEKPGPANKATRMRSVEGLSPQLITPAKTAKPKAKVIQWP